MEVDVTQGKESFPIDGPATSACFQYVKTNVPGPHFDESQFMEDFAGCSCIEHCDEVTCPCARLFGPAYDDNNRLLETWAVDGNIQNKFIFECGSNCSCQKDRCKLRVVQKGINERLKVFETQCKGYGLQAVFGISHFSFVCEYAGEVVGEYEAKRRLTCNERNRLMNYLIAVRECTSSSKHYTYVDPCNVGNIGRFINHSCDPNLIMIPVRVNHPVPRLALFSRRDISPGEELTFDYSGCASLQSSAASDNDDVDDAAVAKRDDVKGEIKAASCGKDLRENIRDVNAKRTRCCCGSENCKGYLPLDDHLFDE